MTSTCSCFALHVYIVISDRIRIRVQMSSFVYIQNQKTSVSSGSILSVLLSTPTCSLAGGCCDIFLEAGNMREDLVVLFLSGMEIDDEECECLILIVVLAPLPCNCPSVVVLLVRDGKPYKVGIAYDFDEWEPCTCECECDFGSILELLYEGGANEGFLKFVVNNGAADGDAFLADDLLGGGVVFGAGK